MGTWGCFLGHSLGDAVREQGPDKTGRPTRWKQENSTACMILAAFLAWGKYDLIKGNKPNFLTKLREKNEVEKSFRWQVWD